MLQLGAFSDSARAAAMRDSLAREGWIVFVARHDSASRTRWRVHALPTASRALAEQAVAAMRRRGGDFADAIVTRAVPPAGVRDAGADVWIVNRGTRGMAARVRWALSPDRRALVAVEDPAAVEAEPVPDGVILANEVTETLVHADQVWDAHPSPDWRQLALSWAFVIQGRDAPTIPRARWVELARRISPTFARSIASGASGQARTENVADRLRRSAFPVSGMSIAYGVGLVQVVRVDSVVRGAHVLNRDDPPDRRVLRSDGWRLRWTPDGALAVGVGMRGAQEFSPPVRWVLVDPERGDSLGVVADTTSLARVAWIQGPTIDFASVHDLPAPSPIIAGRRRVESRDGWIRVRDGAGVRIVGPGQALAATASARFVVALAPNTNSREPHPMQLVVYRIDP